MIPSDFFDTAVAKTATLIGMQDAHHITMTNDQVARLCVEIAYTQICNRCKRRLHYEERTERYAEITGPMKIKNAPVDMDQPIIVKVNHVVQTPDTYCIAEGVLYLGVTEPDESLEFDPVLVHLTNTGGFLLAGDNDMLESGLVIQGVGNYNRKDLFGFKQTQGERGTTKTPSDDGDLLQSVIALIEPLCYYGPGSDCAI